MARQTGPLWFLLPGAALLAGMTLNPVVQLVRMSFSNVTGTNLLGTWSWVGLANFGQLLQDQDFIQSVEKSVIFTLAILLIDLVGGFLAALLLSHRSALSSVAQGLMILGYALPAVVTGSLWKFLLFDNGALNALLAAFRLGPVPWLSSASMALPSVIGVAAWTGIPFAAIVIKGGLLGISPEVLEAAAIDGAGTWNTLRRIVLPLLRPVVLTLAILIALHGFATSFGIIYVVTSGGPGNATTTLPYYGYVDAFSNLQFGLGAAAALISMACVALLAIPYLRSGTREARAQ